MRTRSKHEWIEALEFGFALAEQLAIDLRIVLAEQRRRDAVLDRRGRQAHSYNFV